MPWRIAPYPPDDFPKQPRCSRAARVLNSLSTKGTISREIVRVIADRGGVHVLVAAERREAIRQDDDRRSHFSLADKPRRALRDVVAEGPPVGVSEPRSGEADEVVEHREAALPAFVVLRRQPHAELAHVRIAPGIVLQDLRAVLYHEERAGGAFGAFEGHGVFSVGEFRAIVACPPVSKVCP